MTRKSNIHGILPMAFIGGMLSTSALVQAQPQTGDTSLRLEEVIVSARKRDENVQDIPLSISAISGAQIENAHLPDVRSLEGMVPNLSFTQSSEGSSQTLQAFIRGVGTDDFALTLDPGVGIYVDGVYMARTVGSNLEFNDIQGITVLRGPQGTLFGRNTIGGAIDVVTKKPSHDTSLDVTVSAGNYDHYGLSVYGETSLVDNVLSGSLSVTAKQSDGWQKRERVDNAGNDDSWGLRGHLLWTPTDQFSSHLVLDYTDQDQQVRPVILETFNGAPIFPFLYNQFVGECCTVNANIDSSNASDKTHDIVEAFGVSWTNEWEFDGFNLRSITGYRDLETDQYRDSDNSPEAMWEVGTLFDHDQFSQELVITGTAIDDRLEWTAGVYYFEEEGTHISEVLVAEGLFEALSAQPLSVTLPNGPPVAFLAVPLDLMLTYDRQQKVRSYAAYFHGGYRLTDALRLTVAGRFTRDEKDLDVFTLRRASQTPIIGVGQTDEPTCSDVVSSGNGSQYSCKESWSEFSPKVGIDYEIREGMMAYAHISKGFRSGAFNARPLAIGEISTADPETLTSYELGFKTSLAEQTVQVNGALFYNEYEDQQFLVNRSSEAAGGALALIVENAAESNAWGAELEVSALLGDYWSIDGGVSYIDPEYDEFITEVPDPQNPGAVITQDVSSRVFAYTPDWTGHLGVQFATDLSGGGHLRLRTDVAYKGEIYYTFDEAASAYDLFNVEGYATLNAGVTYITADERWEFAVYGRNLTDKRRINGGTVVDAFGMAESRYNEPARYFASVRYLMR